MQKIAKIQPEMILEVIKNFRKRLQNCFGNDGNHLNDVIFQTDKRHIYFII